MADANNDSSPHLNLTVLKKNLPAILTLIGMAVGSFGVWFQKDVMSDPAFVETFGNWANVPGWAAMISGSISTLVGIWTGKTNVNILETAVVKKDEHIKAALKAPSQVPQGVDPVTHRLNHAMVEALSLSRTAEAQAIMETYTRINQIRKTAGEQKVGGAA